MGHPDQATEPIVEWASRNNKAFAVVPCCVFPSLFGARRQSVGGPGYSVRNYSTFMSYLVDVARERGASDVQRGLLAVDGRNQVIFSRAEQVTEAELDPFCCSPCEDVLVQQQ